MLLDQTLKVAIKGVKNSPEILFIIENAFHFQNAGEVFFWIFLERYSLSFFQH